jgi:hypothetical protein
LRRRKKQRNEGHFLELSAISGNKILNYESEEGDGANIGDVGIDGLKHVY